MEKDTVLSSSTPLIENIFQNLSARELCKCACVCKLWNYFSTSELNRRKRVVHFFQGLKCTVHNEIHTSFQYCSMETAYNSEKELFEQFENLRIKPAFCIVFATSGFWRDIKELFPNCSVSEPPKRNFKRFQAEDSSKKHFETVIKNIFKNHLPPDCQICLFISNSIVSSHCSNVVGIRETPALCGYFFPELSGEELKFCMRKECDGDILKTIISRRDDIKTTLTLVEHKDILTFSTILEELKRGFNAFKNGIVLPVQVGSNIVPVFLGPNVRTSCFEVFTFENETVRLKQLVQTGFFKKQTIAFMFAGEFKSILRVCKELYALHPKIPIAGLYGKPLMESVPFYFADHVQNGMRETFNLFIHNCKCILISFNDVNAV